MKKRAVFLFFILCCSLYGTEECINRPQEGQACVGGQNIQSKVEVSDKAGRQMIVEFSPRNVLECRIILRKFRPNEKYRCSIVTYGETHSLQGQVSKLGQDEFTFNLTPEQQVRCSCSGAASTIEVFPEDGAGPLKVTINWEK